MNRTEFKAQIEELPAIYGAEAFDTDRLNWLVEAFETKYPEHLPLPYLFPIDEFEYGVRVVWDSELGLDVDLKGRNSWWPAYGADCMVRLDLGKTAGWDWLISRLSSLLTKQTAEQRKELKMTTIHIEAVDLLAIVGKCKDIKENAAELAVSGSADALVQIEQHLEAITDTVIEAAKAEYGKVEA